VVGDQALRPRGYRPAAQPSPRKGPDAHRSHRSVAGCAAAAGTYINPFAGEAWAPSRNDQGVDYELLKIGIVDPPRNPLLVARKPGRYRYSIPPEGATGTGFELAER
jgi:hypothetical protein